MPKNIMKVAQIPKLQRKKRVAAYARVSSGKDAMLHSLSAQVSYYNDLIQREDSWEFAGVYSDEAVTGTNGKTGIRCSCFLRDSRPCGMLRPAPWQWTALHSVSQR